MIETHVLSRRIFQETRNRVDVPRLLYVAVVTRCVDVPLRFLRAGHRDSDSHMKRYLPHHSVNTSPPKRPNHTNHPAHPFFLPAQQKDY